MAERKIDYKISADTSEFREGVEQIHSITEGIEDPFKALGDILEETNSKWLGMLSGFVSGIGALAGVSLGLEQVIEGIKGVAEEAVTLHNLSLESGVSAEKISELVEAAKRADVPADKMQQAFVHLAEAINKARTEGGSALETFQRLGISQEELEHDSPYELLLKIADAYARTDDNLIKLQVNTDLFGGKLAELLPLLDRGGSGIEELGGAAKKAGQVIDNETNESLRTMKEHFDDLAHSIGGALKQLEIWSAKKINASFGDMTDEDFKRWNRASPGLFETPTGQQSAADKSAREEIPKPSIAPPSETFGQMQKQLRDLEADEKLSFQDRAEMERDFWQEKFGEARKGSDQYGQIYQELMRLDEQSAREAERAARERQQKEAEALRNQQADMEYMTHQLEAEYRQRADIAKIWADADKAVAESVTKAEDAEAKSRLEQGLIGEQQYTQMRLDAEQRRYEQDIAALQRRQALTDPALDPVEYQRLAAQIEIAAHKHAENMATISAEGAAKSDTAWTHFVDHAVNIFGSGFAQMLQGHLTFQQMLKQAWNSMVAGFAQTVFEMTLRWALGEQTKTQITQLETTRRFLVEQARSLEQFITMCYQRIAAWLGMETANTSATIAGSAETVATKKMEAAMTIPASAAEAATAAMNSVAAIPYVGWAMAPGVFAETLALGMSSLAVAAASGGYDIPAGVNPMTQLHAREMVLPAPIADTVRSAMTGGGGGGRTVNVHYNDYSGSRSPSDLGDMQSAVVKAGREAARRFALS